MSEAARAQRTEATIALDGATVSFLVIGGNNVWAAYGNAGNVAVTLSSDGYRPADIVLVSTAADDYVDV